MNDILIKNPQAVMTGLRGERPAPAASTSASATGASPRWPKTCSRVPASG